MKNDSKSTENEIRDTIEIILREASAFGLRREVRLTALSLLEKYPEMDTIQAYEAAYFDWVK